MRLELGDRAERFVDNRVAVSSAGDVSRQRYDSLRKYAL